MYIDRIYQPVTTLGPGKRIVVWTSGCTKHCYKCANPELWEASASQKISVKKLASVLQQISNATGINRITFTGGDPLEQADELALLLQIIRPKFIDVLVYTGYRFEELENKISKDALQTIKTNCDVIIDGPYVDSLNDGICGLRGSTNQRVFVLTTSLKDEYDRYIELPRRVQNIVFNEKAMSIGIHSPIKNTENNC